MESTNLISPYARSLLPLQAMRSRWDLPGDWAAASWLNIVDPRKDTILWWSFCWFSLYLCSLRRHNPMMELLLTWRILHAHIEWTHEKPMVPVESSHRFLVSRSHLNPLVLFKRHGQSDLVKEKQVVTSDYVSCWRRVPATPLPPGSPVPSGWTKLNVPVGTAGSQGMSIAVWFMRMQMPWLSMKRVPLAVQWTQCPIIQEFECSGPI
jgi:hypothetical protein